MQYKNEHTSVDVNLIQRILREGQHSHIRTELFHESTEYIISCRGARHTYTFCRYFCSFVLIEKSHNTEEPELLEIQKYIIKFMTILKQG